MERRKSDYQTMINGHHKIITGILFTPYTYILLFFLLYSSLKFDASSLKSTLLQSFVEVTLILIAQYKKGEL